MNLVHLIESQLSDEVIGKLSSLIGAHEGATRSAAGAAVPALLSGLTNLAGSAGGAQKLNAALGKFEGGSLVGNLTHMLTDKPGSLLELGSSLLSSLLGGNVLSGITGALARFAGIGSGSAQKLLGYLLPVVLGGIAGRFAGKAISPQGLTSLLTEQKANIHDAVPSGFSLNSIPGLAAAGSAVRTGVGEAQQAGASLMRWLLPLAGLALLALLAWLFFQRPTKSPTTGQEVAGITVPDVGEVTKNLTGSFKSVSDSLAGIKDAASAATAVPKLKEIGDKLDGMKAMVDKLPEAGKAKVTDLIKSNLNTIDDQIAKLQWIPGVGDKIKAAADEVQDKMASLGGLQVPQTSKVSSELAGMFSSMTDALTGIKDAASADAALPKLQEVKDKLDASKAMVAGLPESGKATINSLLKVAIGKLRELADKVVGIAGAADKVKPVVDSIIGKLNALTT
jgi:hypothetical protein